MVQVDLPAGSDLRAELIRSWRRVGQGQQRGIVTVGRQLPEQAAVDVTVPLEHAWRLEAGDAPVVDGGVAVLIGVEPGDLDRPALLQLELRLAEPCDEPLGLRESVPDLLDRMRVAAFELQNRHVSSSSRCRPSASSRLLHNARYGSSQASSSASGAGSRSYSRR